MREVICLTDSQSGPGRPTKKTEAILKLFEEALEAGTTYQDACNFAGIHLGSFQAWMKAGKTADEGSWDREFYERCIKAEGKMVVEAVRYISRHKDWKAKMTLLARKYPERYGRQPADPQKLDVKVTYVTSDDLANARKAAEEFERDLFDDGDEDDI